MIEAGKENALEARAPEASVRFSPDELFERASLRVAMHMRGLWEEKGSSDTRLLESFFLPDRFTVVGRSLAYDGKGRREHVVPRLVVVEACHEMLERGETDQAIAQFIRENVKVVLISDEECQQLDRKDQLGLRQRMPKDWSFGQDVYARLSAAGIEWRPYTISGH